MDIRAFATDRHRTVDDYPYGGGPGMVMRPEPLVAAIESVRRPASRVMLLAPTGPPLHPGHRPRAGRRAGTWCWCAGATRASTSACGWSTDAEELSIGDFVLTGGELAAMVVLDAVMRLLPGVLSTSDAWRDESHSLEGLLEYPQYTRRPSFAACACPDVLLSGHHAQVAAWRRRQALERTRERRPDLLTPEHLGELGE